MLKETYNTKAKVVLSFLVILIKQLIFCFLFELHITFGSLRLHSLLSRLNILHDIMCALVSCLFVSGA